MNVGTTVVDRVLGSPLLVGPWRAGTRRSLRILGYHGVDDPSRFEAHLVHLRRWYQPVGVGAVVEWLGGGADLPERAVWVTFDDGVPSVIDAGLPLLVSYEVPSTIFICPGVIDSDRPLWFQVVDSATAAGVTVEIEGRRFRPTEVAALKRLLKGLPDERRRKAVAGIEASLGDRNRRRQATTGELQQYVRSGGTLGNHTWDHPMLATCPPQVQVDQVTSAERWIEERFPGWTPTFSYPDGAAGEATETCLAERGYALAVGFDHRLAGREGRLVLSRLRVNSSTSVHRFRAIVAGVHPWVHHHRPVRTTR